MTVNSGKRYTGKGVWNFGAHGAYDEPLAELEEERERQTALLEEFYIYSNPAYIYLKGDARICLEDGRELRIYHDLPMSIL